MRQHFDGRNADLNHQETGKGMVLEVVSPGASELMDMMKVGGPAWAWSSCAIVDEDGTMNWEVKG